MRLIHLSDLHFGTEENYIVTALDDKICELKPDLVVISGDFTQVGSEKEFTKAQHFLESLPCPYFCVPGNHDVPAYNLLTRLTRPYKDYRKAISQDLDTCMEMKDLKIIGLNSARRALPHWNWANGAISKAQRLFLQDKTVRNRTKWTVCVLHHPVHKVQDMPIDVTVFGRKRTMHTLQALDIDLVLTGHVHHASISLSGDPEHQVVFLSASTALSSRLRDQENGFNVIDINDNSMDISVLSFQDNGFKVLTTYQHPKINNPLKG